MHATSHVYKDILTQIRLHTLCVCAKSLHLCLTLCDPIDCSPPGSSVCRILQARILEWVAMSSRGSSWPRDGNPSHISCTDRQVLYHWRHLGSPRKADARCNTTATTQIRTEVAALTTQSTNHYTISAHRTPMTVSVDYSSQEWNCRSTCSS